MVIVKKENIHQIPVLHIAQQDKWNQKLPLIIFIHGITSAKEHNLHYAYLLAEKGFRVVLPDCLYHGERDKGLSENKLKLAFWEIVLNTIKEIELIKEHYQKHQLIDSFRIGIAGTSMGGIITFGALAHYDWLKTGVSLMGNPAYVSYAQGQIQELKDANVELPLSQAELDGVYTMLAEFDLTLQPEKLAGRPLFFWHGEKDSVVPYRPAYEFYESILAEYGNYKEKLSFILEKGAGHKVSREGVLKTQEWFVHNL